MQLSLLELFTGVLITEWTFIFAARAMFGKNINAWYTQYGIWAILSDVSSIMIGLLIAMYLYRGPSLLTLTGYAVVVQWVHDILFYLLAIVPTPYGVNGIIDILKPYSREAGIWAIVGDSWMMIGSMIFATLTSRVPVLGQVGLLLFSTYMIPYAVQQKPSVRM
jgi:hypothetical protein